MNSNTPIEPSALENPHIVPERMGLWHDELGALGRDFYSVLKF
jgi:hypothetical protein